MNRKDTYCDFISKVECCIDSTTINFVFSYGIVKQLTFNGKVVYLWQNVKGDICYSFDLHSQDYHKTSTVKLSSALWNHFDVKIEAVTTIDESLKKVTIAAIRLNKAMSEAQSYHDYSTFSQRELNGQKYGEVDLIQNMNQNSQSNQALIPYQQYPQQGRYNQTQLYSDIINLSMYQLQSVQNTFYIHANELPIVHKEVFKPVAKCAFFIEKNFTIRNRYIPSEYLSNGVAPYNLSNSFIISFIFAMAKNDIAQAMNILVWLVNSINTLLKLPYALVLHGENDTFMKLFYEEIVTPLFNDLHCEKITGDGLNEKSLSKQLDEKIVNNFHNITTPIVLDSPAKEFTNRLIHKDVYKLNNKSITTVANILITSTSKYIPLIAKDVPCLVVGVESTVDYFCKDKNISTDPYKITYYIKNDLYNFVSIIRSIDLGKVNMSGALKFYKDKDNTDIIDGDVDLLVAFNVFIKNKDKGPFVLLQKIAPKLYKTLIDDFSKNRVNRKNLIEYFTILFGEDIYKKNQNRKLIDDLRELSNTNEPFDCDMAHNIHGVVYYYL